MVIWLTSLSPSTWFMNDPFLILQDIRKGEKISAAFMSQISCTRVDSTIRCWHNDRFFMKNHFQTSFFFGICSPTFSRSFGKQNMGGHVRPMRVGLTSVLQQQNLFRKIIQYCQQKLGPFLSMIETLIRKLFNAFMIHFQCT